MTTHDATEPHAPPPARARRARARKLRRIAAAACLLAPGLLALGVDILHRPGRIFGFGPLHAIVYWWGTITLILVWAALLSAASRRRGRVRQAAAGVFAVLFAFAAGT